MANANSRNNRFVGIVEEKSEVNKTKQSEKPVINFIVPKTRKLFGDIAETIKARIVVFGKDADKAAAEIKEGDVVLFSEVRRNPRSYVTEAGTQVESVDLVARSYQILKKEDYEKNKDKLESLCMSTDELEFTDADRKTLEKAEAALAASVV